MEEYLKSKRESIQVIAVEPKGSSVLSEGRSGPHRIQVTDIYPPRYFRMHEGMEA